MFELWSQNFANRTAVSKCDCLSLFLLTASFCLTACNGGFRTAAQNSGTNGFSSVSSPASPGCPAGEVSFQGTCQLNQQRCTVANGTGSQTLSNGVYGGCVITSCNSGYSLANGSCVASNSTTSPKITSALTLPGCSYPFGGASSGNLGSPLPTSAAGAPSGWVDPTTMQTLQPTYSSNTIFWTSREGSPGNSVLMTGAFTPNAKTIRLAVIPVGTSQASWQALVTNSTTTVSAVNMGSTGLAFKIPTSFTNGVYAYRIEDSSAPTLSGLLNTPQVSWAGGIPQSTSVADSLTHHVYTCGVEAGGILRIFGKNFIPSTAIFLQDSGGATENLQIIKQDENSILAQVPVNMSGGSYFLWLGTSSIDATSSPAYSLTVVPQKNPIVNTVSCPGLVGDGITDNTGVLQQCLTSNASLATGANQLVYLQLPSGNFVIKNTVVMSPYEYLMGQGEGITIITGVASSPPNTWISGTHYFGLANLTVTAPVATVTTSTPPSIIQDST